MSNLLPIDEVAVAISAIMIMMLICLTGQRFAGGE